MIVSVMTNMVVFFWIGYFREREKKRRESSWKEKKVKTELTYSIIIPADAETSEKAGDLFLLINVLIFVQPSDKRRSASNRIETI